MAGLESLAGSLCLSLPLSLSLWPEWIRRWESLAMSRKVEWSAAAEARTIRPARRSELDSARFGPQVSSRVARHDNQKHTERTLRPGTAGPPSGAPHAHADGAGRPLPPPPPLPPLAMFSSAPMQQRPCSSAHCLPLYGPAQPWAPLRPRLSLGPSFTPSSSRAAASGPLRFPPAGSRRPDRRPLCAAYQLHAGLRPLRRRAAHAAARLLAASSKPTRTAPSAGVGLSWRQDSHQVAGVVLPMLLLLAFSCRAPICATGAGPI